MDVEVLPQRHLQKGPLPPGRLGEVQALWAGDPRIGGIVSFAGLIRADEGSEGRVRAIEFSAYEEMAEPGIRQMAERIGRQIAEKHGGPVKIYAEHALGLVEVGEAPILIIAGAGHRPAAFELCRSVLEALKSEIPIYGKELFESSGHRWKKNL